jgi:hypothetical protein
LITSIRPDNSVQQPGGFRLCPNFPNPFNPSTRIVFFLPVEEHISVKVFAVTGQELETLVEGVVPAGEHDLNWDATGLASGMYLCRLQAGAFVQTIRMVYQK